MLLIFYMNLIFVIQFTNISLPLLPLFFPSSYSFSPIQIEALKTQYNEVESSKTQQEAEMSKLMQQFHDLKQEEETLKTKIDTTRSEIQRLQTEHQSVQRGIDQVHNTCICTCK